MLKLVLRSPYFTLQKLDPDPRSALSKSTSHSQNFRAKNIPQLVHILELSDSEVPSGPNVVLVSDELVHAMWKSGQGSAPGGGLT